MTRRGASVHSYSARHRWAYVPTLAFLIVILAILLIDPTLIWDRMDADTRRNATLLAAALALGFAAALFARWASPFRFRLENDALIAEPLIGSARRIPYPTIVDVVAHAKTFMRSVPEVELRVQGARPVVIRSDVSGYGQLERALRRRLSPEVQARWKEERRA